jgi:alpha-tubulin suppressor-like RCC1 family protein
VAVRAPAGVTFTQLAAGGNQTCARGGDTRSYCWGNGFAGALGNGDTQDRSSPVTVHTPAGVSFTQLATGGFHGCGLGSDAKAYCWGYTGELGNGEAQYAASPVMVLPFV